MIALTLGHCFHANYLNSGSAAVSVRNTRNYLGNTAVAGVVGQG